MLARIEGWEGAFLALIQARARAPLHWGTHDCCLFAADVVLAVTGVDLGTPFRGRYKTPRGALGALRRFAGGGVAAAAEKIAERYAIREIPPLMARRGDVGLLPAVAAPGSGFDGALGVCVGATWAVAGTCGLDHVPLAAALRAWRIG